MIIKNKKGMEMTFPIIVGIVIAMLVLVIIGIIIFPKFFTLGGEISKNIISLNDTDKDKVPDFQDKCPCTAALIQSKLLLGCPKNTEEKDALADMNCYSDKGCKDCKKEEASSSSSPTSSTTELSLNLKDNTGKVFSGSVYETSDTPIFYDLVCPSKCTLSFEEQSTSSPSAFKKEYGPLQGSYSFPISSNGKYTLIFKDDKKTISYQIIKK